jgi:hypothetical protein
MSNLLNVLRRFVAHRQSSRQKADVDDVAQRFACNTNARAVPSMNGWTLNPTKKRGASRNNQPIDFQAATLRRRRNRQVSRTRKTRFRGVKIFPRKENRFPPAI